MPYFSSIIATVFGLALGFSSNDKFLIWGQLPARERFWTVFATIYAAVAVIAGWGYILSRFRFLGWIHALLMLGVAGLCGFYGLSVLGNRSILGGSGPDANPVAGIIYGIALVAVAIAAIIAVCGIGVIRHVLRRRTDDRPDTA